MSQTFQVVLCVICKAYQVQIVKKSSNKWNCKVCDSKQSVQQVYAKGTGAECRTIVQRLNEARGKREETLGATALSSVAKEIEEDCEDFSTTECVENKEYQEEACASGAQVTSRLQHTKKLGILSVPPEKSRWTVFLED